MNVWRLANYSRKIGRSWVNSSNSPIKIQFYTFIGKVLVFCGDTFCKYSLDLETNGWMRSSLLLWSIGLGFYNASNKYAWIHIIGRDNPTGKYK